MVGDAVIIAIVLPVDDLAVVGARPFWYGQLSSLGALLKQLTSRNIRVDLDVMGSPIQ